MIRQTPFHSRTSAVNKTGLWSHWAGYLAADRYQMSDKFEYFAVRNSVGVFDTSPLFKYRIDGDEAERYLAGILTRDIRRCRPGQAQYTVWCDDDGWVIEDGVVLRLAEGSFLLSSARPNLAYLEALTSGLSVRVEDISDNMGVLAVQGPHSRDVLTGLIPEVATLEYFGVIATEVDSIPVIVSRTGYTGDLGYEIWVADEHAERLWDRLFDVARPHGGIPVGQDAILISRIEAGLLLIDVDFHSARFAWNDDQRATLLELNMGWMLTGVESDDRAFVGRRAITREIKEGTSRWRTAGVMVDWADWARVHGERGLITPKDHTPNHGGMMIYDHESEQVGYVSSFVYSPILQRHIGIARVHPGYAKPGTNVGLEVTIDHQYDVVAAEVTKLPFYNPPRKTG